MFWDFLGLAWDDPNDIPKNPKKSQEFWDDPKIWGEVRGCHLCYDVLFQIQAKFEVECAEFRRRTGRRRGVQKEQEETKTKKKKG